MRGLENEEEEMCVVQTLQAVHYGLREGESQAMKG